MNLIFLIVIKNFILKIFIKILLKIGKQKFQQFYTLYQSFHLKY